MSLLMASQAPSYLDRRLLTPVARDTTCRQKKLHKSSLLSLEMKPLTT